MKFGLANMARLLEALDHPEASFAAGLIGGTNGKGSVTVDDRDRAAHGGSPCGALHLPAPDQARPSDSSLTVTRWTTPNWRRGGAGAAGRRTARRRRDTAQPSDVLRVRDSHCLRSVSRGGCLARGARSRARRPPRRHQHRLPRRVGIVSIDFDHEEQLGHDADVHRDRKGGHRPTRRFRSCAVGCRRKRSR